MSEWPVRLMVYGAGEAINGGGALSSQISTQLSRLARICTNPHVAAIAQLDSSSVPTQRFVLDPLGRQPVNQLANVNVGDPRQLVDFVTWGAAVCPARSSVLVLSGHGAAWEDSQVDQVLSRFGARTRGPNALPPKPGAVRHARSIFGRDATPLDAITKAILIDGQDRDYLSNVELCSACQRVAAILGGRIDVLVFDACLMSSWELLQQLNGSVRFAIASIDELSAAGIDMAVTAQQITAAGGSMDARAIATSVARNFKPQYAFDSCVAVDLETPSWGAALASFQAFCVDFLGWVRESATNARAARAALQNASGSFVKFSGGGLADVSALAESISAIPNAPQVACASINSAVAHLRACILGHSAGRDYESSMGLSIFSPGSATMYDTNRPEYAALQFPGMTGWAAILDILHGHQSEGVRLVTLAGAPPPSTSEGDAEFVVSLRGFRIDGKTIERLERIIRRTVLEKLAEVDALRDVAIMPVTDFLKDVGVRLALGRPTLGFAVRRVPAGIAKPPVDQIQPEHPIEGRPDAGLVNIKTSEGDTDLEVRVFVRGLRLDATTQSLIDAAIKSASLLELATIDHNGKPVINALATAADTRSPFAREGLPGKVLGFIATMA